MKRRDFLARVGAGVAGVAVWPRPLAAQTAGFHPDVELELRAAPAEVPLLPGQPTRVWRYRARVLSGAPAAVQVIPDSYLGPTLRFETGQKVRVHFVNDLPEPSIVHWHGLDVPTQADGHPRLAVGPGQRYVYEFTVVNRAGTYWYHPHPHMRTAYQAYHGLAGLIVVHDPDEAALHLPSGADELVCVIQDRQFDAGNQLVYASGMMMENMNGFLGDQVLVNGRPAAALSLATRHYRLRLMNGSNSRVYKLAWDPSTPVTVIGTDGGLLERPVTRPYVTLAPGERLDTLLDLSAAAVGTRLTLRSLPFPASLFTMQMGMGGGMGRGGRGRGGGRGADRPPVPQGAPLEVLAISVDRRERSAFALPAALSHYEAAWQPPPDVPTRSINIDFMRMQFFLGARTFEMDDVAAEESVRAGSTHIWAYDNSGPGMMMNMRLGHPMHMHGRQFRVLRRTVEPGRRADWQALKDGFVDDGWKDTTLVLPGERVECLVKFSDYRGLFLYHCHNLEHEDMGMMRNYRIV